MSVGVNPQRILRGGDIVDRLGIICQLLFYSNDRYDLAHAEFNEREMNNSDGRRVETLIGYGQAFSNNYIVIETED